MFCEYVVCMCCFVQQDLFSVLVCDGCLCLREIDVLVDLIVDFYVIVFVCGLGLDDGIFVSIQCMFEDCVGGVIVFIMEFQIVVVMVVLFCQYVSCLEVIFVLCWCSCYICECYGDFYLGNIVLIYGQLMLFDCLEFFVLF